MIHIWNWLLNVTGVNYGQNNFATHMYNFWSGLGADITEFALLGTLVAVYRHHVKSSRLLNKHILEALHNHKKENHSPQNLG